MLYFGGGSSKSDDNLAQVIKYQTVWEYESISCPHMEVCGLWV